jgi:hypothetical protein
MELTQAVHEEIDLAAREINSGRLTITIDARPEDTKNFDMRLEFEKRFRLSRTGRQALPTVAPGTLIPRDKYSG